MKLRKSLHEFEIEDKDGAVFSVRQLSEMEIGQVNYDINAMGDDKSKHLPPRVVDYILRKALLSWSGVKDEDGAPIKYEDGLSDFLPHDVRIRLASTIFVRSIFTESEKKSLSSLTPYSQTSKASNATHADGEDTATNPDLQKATSSK